MSYLETKNQIVLIDGKKIAYRELGQGNSNRPLVMLVHLAATMDNWDPELLDLVAQRQMSSCLICQESGLVRGRWQLQFLVWPLKLLL